MSFRIISAFLLVAGIQATSICSTIDTCATDGQVLCDRTKENCPPCMYTGSRFGCPTCVHPVDMGEGHFLCPEKPSYFAECPATMMHFPDLPASGFNPKKTPNNLEAKQMENDKTSDNTLTVTTTTDEEGGSGSTAFIAIGAAVGIVGILGAVYKWRQAQSKYSDTIDQIARATVLNDLGPRQPTVFASMDATPVKTTSVHFQV